MSDRFHGTNVWETVPHNEWSPRSEKHVDVICGPVDAENRMFLDLEYEGPTEIWRGEFMVDPAGRKILRLTRPAVLQPPKT